MGSKAPGDAAAKAPCARLGEVLLDSSDSCCDRRKIASLRHEQAAHNELKLQAQLARVVVVRFNGTCRLDTLLAL